MWTKSRRPSVWWITVVNNSANFLLHLLAQNTVLTGLQLQVFAPSNNSCIANACKKFKPTCSNLECHNLIESQSNYSKDAKFLVICITFQIVLVVASNAFQNNQWATEHLGNAFSKSSPKALCFQSSNWDKFLLQLKNVSHIFQLSYYPIRQLDTYPFDLACVSVAEWHQASIYSCKTSKPLLFGTNVIDSARIWIHSDFSE